jgi:hypothetical protein
VPHAKLLRNFRNCGAILRRPNYAFPQIVRIRLSHSMLAALPVRILNPIRAQKGIPPDSVIPEIALARVLRQLSLQETVDGRESFVAFLEQTREEIVAVWHPLAYEVFNTLIAVLA